LLRVTSWKHYWIEPLLGGTRGDGDNGKISESDVRLLTI